MNIVIACGSMPFGPKTPMFRSLGGSEMAALMLGKALAQRGHQVSMFCHLPQQGPDAWPAGGVDEAGVCYLPVEGLQPFVTVVPHDLYIGVRDPAFFAMPTQSKKRVLWMHDIATKRGMQRALDQMAWTIDEIWTVSEWHRQQVHATTGYPLQFIKALRNGIVPVEVLMAGARIPKTLLYAARPERGLENLIKPGGVMENLPEYKLQVAMYAHFPEHMRGYYEMIFARMKQMPNVEYVGEKSQPELRQMIADCEAYIYPTQFEETSCILARECIEQFTPFLTTRVGALEETLGDCGLFFEDWWALQGASALEAGSPEWCIRFADFVRNTLSTSKVHRADIPMTERRDLYWPGVAEMVEQNATAVPGTLFSRLWSLIQDGDVIPARALMNNSFAKLSTEPLGGISAELISQYAFVERDMADFYETMYVEKGKTAETELVFSLDHTASPRYQSIRREIAKLPPGSKVLEYGCGPGHMLAPLAKEFPNLVFVGTDYSASAMDVLRQGGRENKLGNLIVRDGAFSNFDAVICSEVLEHTVEPWKLLTEIEKMARLDGRMILTVPFGAWEPTGYERAGHWGERQHLWQIDQQMFKDMQGNKPNHQFLHMPVGMDRFAHSQGQLLVTYNADHREAVAVDPLAKAMRHWPRQTIAAAIIAMNNEDTILKLLNSLDRKVQFVQIALGPCTDKTPSLLNDWFHAHPWVRSKIINVPKIEPWKFGFDDARNASMEGLARDFEWVLWIDTDEYLVGEPNKYVRANALDGYLISQHHFTVEPRGKPPEIDRPARLIRTDRGFKARGHIHEHFEIPAGGPGMCAMLPDVDIGHPGYANEEVRKARFFRNYPFLEWDHKTEGADRKLHHFLWFRDIVHRMRFVGMGGDSKQALELAKEGVAYYNAHVEDMAVFGPGLQMSLAYLGECHSVLGIGVPLKIAVQLDDRGAGLEGRFENFDQVTRVLKQLLEPEFKDRTSRYY